MRPVLFLDIDSLLVRNTSSKDVPDKKWFIETHFKRENAYTKGRLAKLNGYELQSIVAWDADMGSSLGEVAAEMHRMQADRERGLATVAITSADWPLESLKTMLACLKVYISSVVKAQVVTDGVMDYLNHLDEEPNYCLVTRCAPDARFLERTIQVDGPTLSPAQQAQALRLLSLGLWYEQRNYASLRECDDWYNARRSDCYHKVVFLDIDGVLNDEGETYRDGFIIDPGKVDLLADIVRATDAEIVLTSSWRYAYQRFARNGHASNDEHLLTLQTELDRTGLRIAGMTPTSDLSGSVARPAEIRSWLDTNWKTESFVILEDDTFWEWGWLQRNVVSTLTRNPSSDGEGMHPHWRHEYTKGLTTEHAERAIRILNERGAAKHPS